MTGDQGSKGSLMEATRSRAKFSAHGGKGAAGFLSPHDEGQDASFLSKPGETAIVNPPADGLPDIEIGVAWDVRQVQKQKQGFLDKLLGRTKTVTAQQDVDLDLGCFYELQDGTRGAIQAFGKNFGSYDSAPYISLAGDERTGESEGEDEKITINGAHWNDIKRVLIYLYIYEGADDFQEIEEQIQVRVPGEKPMVVTLHAHRDEMELCAVAGLENIRGGIRMTNYLEYFPGHESMDRAFGFGLQWEEGTKQP